jgi:hypothetical protein
MHQITVQTILRGLAPALFFLLSACTDLDVIPEDRISPDVLYADESNYERVLARIYAGLAVTGQEGPAGNADIRSLDEGFGQYIRALYYLQEIPTETVVVGWGDIGLPELVYQTWTSDNPFVRAMYYRAFYQVSIANEFLRETTPERLDSRGIREDFRPTVEDFRAEARFLRAFSYWHAIDMFGGTIFYTEEDPIGGTPPSTRSRTEIFDYILAELDAIEEQLPAIGASEYGRIDRGALHMLRAKLYQNAEVYTGQDRSGEAIADLEAIIDSEAYSLMENYQDLFAADNDRSQEFIFVIPYDGDRTRTFGGTTFLTHAPVGGEMQAVDYGIDGGWGGLRTTPQFVNYFPDVTGEADERAIFFTEGQTEDVGILSEFGRGYAVPKFTNLTSDGEVGSDLRFADTDFPFFRLGDVYLMYAESVLRSGSGDRARALELVNELRERAYDGSGGDISDEDLTLDFILDERARELYWECHRRTDLIRFNNFSTNGVWAWKGGVQEGRTTEAFRNLYPIPTSEIISNPNLSQNEGY